MSALALVTPEDLAEEADALEREAPPAGPPVASQERASAMEAQAAALLRLAGAARELAAARAYVAQLGIAEWCARCDDIMPAGRAEPTCSRCTRLANKARWQRDARLAASPTRTTTQE